MTFSSLVGQKPIDRWEDLLVGSAAEIKNVSVGFEAFVLQGVEQKWFVAVCAVTRDEAIGAKQVRWVCHFIDDRFTVQARPATEDDINFFDIDQIASSAAEVIAFGATVFDDRDELGLGKFAAVIDFLNCKYF